MATVVREDSASRPFDINFKQRSHSIKLQVYGAPDELLEDTGVYDEVIAWLATEGFNEAYFGARIEGIKGEPESDNFWRVTVSYGSGYVPDNELGTTSLPEVEFTGSTRGSTARITQTLETVNAFRVIYPGGSYAPATDNSGSIGVSREGDNMRVEGVDIIVPRAEETAVLYMTDANFTGAYKSTLRLLTGSVNDDVFFGMQSGEVLFTGADWSRYSNTLWKVSYFFEYELNSDTITIGPETGIEKRGFDYLWVSYKDHVDSGSSRITRRPDEVYVERVYPYRDLALLAPGIFA